MKTETISARIPAVQKRLLEAVAAEDGVTVCDLLRAAAREIIQARYGRQAVGEGGGR
jgi:hypothetical protein